MTHPPIESLLRQHFPPQQFAIHGIGAYASDASYASPIYPQAVFYVEKTKDIPIILSLANHYKIPITGRGAGTGKSGGSIPEPNGIVLSFERMNKIIDINIKTCIAEMESGVITGDLKIAAEKLDLYYPVDPASLAQCTIGGNVLENAGGPNAFRYGVTRNYVTGLEGYFGNGEAFKLGGKLYKDVAGYDLKQLLIGSEGTLGLVTKIYLKLIPKPHYSAGIWMMFDDLNHACYYITSFLRRYSNVVVAEFMPLFCIESTLEYLGHHSLPIQKPLKKAFHALILIEDQSKQALKQTLSYFSKHFSTCNQNEMKALINFRQNISLALSKRAIHKRSDDITVPPDKVESYMSFLDQLNYQNPYTLTGYGHLGDGNIHSNILNMNPSISDQKWSLDSQALSDLCMETALSLGGTPSGEHGIGILKKKWLPHYFSPFELSIMKQIKHYCDPNNILNPSKLFI